MEEIKIKLLLLQCKKNINKELKMTVQEFEKLSNELRLLADNIPLQWGRVQNNKTDDKIDMFQINSYDKLEQEIAYLDEDSKNYLRRRWYLWKCSECDEYLFYCNEGVEKNPNKFDKSYDVKIANEYFFDIKGTVVPKNMRCNVENVLKHPEEMIDFFYDSQSQGRRYDIQNRLFIVHHSFCQPERELYLRCAWRAKQEIYEMFCKEIHNICFYKTHKVKAGVIFILERQMNLIEHKIYGL